MNGPSAEPTPAAVFIPFHRTPAGELRVVLIKRTPFGAHGGEIALPGGKYEPEDADMRDTAVRETCEELGLEPDVLTVLEDLPPLETFSTGFKVWPFVGRLHQVPDRWQPQQREVEQVLDLAVEDLVDPAARGTQEMDLGRWGRAVQVPVWRVEGHVIWGLTLRILEPVLPRALDGEYPV
ncbi:NUDIX hydrolase [Pseudonocardia spinosispora]|uniref:NUDIX hydrolase n=1 Tax=Pseudonocardia spinosispora TaxID=103441 RepID=UPI001FDFF653|nr:CoA pyrophosphatase [Pseudonocardia spinosispora]